MAFRGAAAAVDDEAPDFRAYFNPEAAGRSLWSPEARTRRGLVTSEGLNPDREAELRRAARELRMPVELARAKADETIRRADNQRTMSLLDLGRHVATSRLLSDTSSAAIARRDVPVLVRIEELVREGLPSFLYGLARGPAGLAADVGNSGAREVLRNPRAVGSFVGRKAQAGFHNLAAAGAQLLDNIQPFTTSDEDLAVLYRNDPAGLARARRSSMAGLSRFARGQQAQARQTVDGMSPEAKAVYGELRYATVDPNKAAYASPVKVIGDALESLPTTLALAITTYLTRGASIRAEQAALARGATAEVARQEGIKAAGSMAARFGAVSEGAISGAQQQVATQVELESLPEEQLRKSPEYQRLIAEGFSPEAARLYLAARTARQSGLGSAMAIGATNLVGGRFLGRIIGEGGALLPRAAKGFGNEAAVEAVQSAGEQLVGNVAEAQNIDPYKDITDGVLESALAGFFVGGLTGGTFAGVLGRAVNKEAQAERAQAALEHLAELMKLAEASRLRKLDPETFQQFVERASEDEFGLQDIYLDSAQLGEVLNASDAGAISRGRDVAS
ncbi:MAG: hypothetical protein M3Q08_00170 [Pseudomonadota bacterium]|nr:hypothetical protein [Pseudomonadota bacterium]